MVKGICTADYLIIPRNTNLFPFDGVSQRFLRKNYKYRQLGTEINKTKEMSENVVLYCLANSINVAAKFKFPQLAITL